MQGRQPLHLTVIGNASDAAAELVIAGVDVNAQNKQVTSQC